MKTVLLVTIFRVPNFGSVLQAYATQCLLESWGYKCQILNYDHNKSLWARKNGVKSAGLKNYIGRLLGVKPAHRKANKLDEFIKENFHLTKKYFSFEDIKKNEGSTYDVYVAGSDQIWNTKFTNCDPVFLLEFAKDSKHRISIASSFACKKLDPKYIEEFKIHLQKFNAISVRETLGSTVLNSIDIKKSHQVLDPTLLLDYTQWNKLRKDVSYHEKYILLYMWCYAFEPRPYIYQILKKYQRQLNCKIVVLEGFNACSKENIQNLKLVDATDSSISDFLNYFANASLVVTSSFHGTAFAVNFGVPLISVAPNGDDDRQSSLLKQLSLECCCLKVGENINKANPFYDRDEEQIILRGLREDSLNWIKSSLN